MKTTISLLFAGFFAMLNGCAVDGPPEPAVAVGGVGTMPTETMAGDDSDYFAGALPDELVDGVVATLDRTPFEDEVIDGLYAYGEDNPDDARPWLLLAGDSMRAGRLSVTSIGGR